PAEERALDGAGARQANEGGRLRRGSGQADGGDDPFDDPAGAADAARDRRLAPPADRPGQRHHGPAGESVTERAQADAEDDEAAREGKEAGPSSRDPTGRPEVKWQSSSG